MAVQVSTADYKKMVLSRTICFITQETITPLDRPVDAIVPSGRPPAVTTLLTLVMSRGCCIIGLTSCRHCIPRVTSRDQCAVWGASPTTALLFGVN